MMRPALPIPTMPEPVRLSRRLIELTGCSRRQAELYIEGGWVTVAGVVVDQPQFPVLDQQVALDPQAQVTRTESATLLLHKPAGMTSAAAVALASAASRWEHDSSGIRQLPRHLRQLQPVFEIEAPTSGLLVLTQDGRQAARIDEDGYRIEQEWTIDVEGEIVPNGLARLSRGLHHAEGRLPPMKASWQSESRLRFAIKDVQPGQLQWMCAQVGLHVLSARRIRIGRIPLGRMPVGAWRYLPPAERF